METRDIHQLFNACSESFIVTKSHNLSKATEYIKCFEDTESAYFSYSVTQKIMSSSVAAIFSDTLSNLGCA